MAKRSTIERNLKRKRMVLSHAKRRKELKAMLMDKALDASERFEISQKLAKLPRNSSPSRVRNRCELTGRPRGYYRKIRMSRIALRELSANGLIPGMLKSSW